MPRRNIALTVIFLACATVLFTGCSESRHDAVEKYFLVATNIKIPYWQSAAAGFAAAGKELGVKYEFVGPDSYDAKAEVQEFRRILSSKSVPAGILVSAADAAAMRPEIDRAVAQGVPVITLDSDSKDSKRLLYIGTDNFEAGVMAARVVAGQLKGKGNVAIYTMPEQANLNDRLRGYRDVFTAYPQIKITEVVDVKGNPAAAFDKTVEIVEKSPASVDAFACLVSFACKEVAEVLDRKHISGKVIVGMDAEDLTLEWVRRGVIAATVVQKPFTMAFTGLKMLDDFYHHKPKSLDAKWADDPFSPIPVFVDTGATLVDKTNVDAFLRARSSATAGKAN